eukprot:2082681-Rhodomonas_salina.1
MRKARLRTPRRAVVVAKRDGPVRPRVHTPAVDNTRAAMPQQKALQRPLHQRQPAPVRMLVHNSHRFCSRNTPRAPHSSFHTRNRQRHTF